MLGALAAIQGKPRLDDTSVVPPLDRMAALPQAFIMQQAQKGQIPKEMVAPILAKKAENAQAAAMQNAAFKQAAMQGGPVPPSTVIEGIIAKNAQAEVGIPTVAGNNVSNPAFMRSGGIVAFGGDGEDESYVNLEKIKKRLADMENMGPRDVSLAPVRDKDKPSIDFNPALLPEGISAGEIPYEGGSEGERVTARVKEILDLRKQTLGDAPKMDTSPEITGRALAFAGLQAVAGMGQGPNFLSNVISGFKPGVASLAKTPRERAEAEFKAKQTEYLAKSGAIDEALKTVGRREEKEDERSFVKDESQEDRDFQMKKQKDQQIFTAAENIKKFQASLDVANVGKESAADVARIRANAPPEVVKMARALNPNFDTLLPAAKAEALRKGAEIAGKYTSVDAARLGLAKVAMTAASELLNEQFSVSGISRHILEASENYSGLTAAEKQAVDAEITAYNKSNPNSPIEFNEAGAKVLKDKIYTTFASKYSDMLQAVGLNPENIKGVFDKYFVDLNKGGGSNTSGGSNASSSYSGYTITPTKN